MFHFLENEHANKLCVNFEDIDNKKIIKRGELIPSAIFASVIISGMVSDHVFFNVAADIILCSELQVGRDGVSSNMCNIWGHWFSCMLS